MSDTGLRGLYAITDETLIQPEIFAQTIERALRGGANIIQYRDKSNDSQKRRGQAKQLRALCDQYHALLIINDDPELAKISNADGVHLGKHDTNVEQARDYLGTDFIIGVSCYNSLEDAVTAENKGASYVAFGAIFSSKTKPDARTASIDLLRSAKQRLNIPVCAIGGIDVHNAEEIIKENIDMIATINGVFNQKDVLSVARELSGLFKT